MVNYPVLKAFVFDLITSVLTAAAVWLSVPENVESMGFADYAVPIVVGLAGAAALAIRRYRIENKS